MPAADSTPTMTGFYQQVMNKCQVNPPKQAKAANANIDGLFYTSQITLHMSHFFTNGFVTVPRSVVTRTK